MKNLETMGFGCPNEIDPHHFAVTIPKERGKFVTITEHLGIRGESCGISEGIVRAKLSRAQWKLIKSHSQSFLNKRLRDNKIKPSCWQTGENKIERLLGKELTVLVWAIELAELDLVPTAIKNWVGLKPEERWWLFTITAAATGHVEDGDKGWRKALRYALTENPTDLIAATNLGRLAQ